MAVELAPYEVAAYRPLVRIRWPKAREDEGRAFASPVRESDASVGATHEEPAAATARQPGPGPEVVASCPTRPPECASRPTRPPVGEQPAGSRTTGPVGPVTWWRTALNPAAGRGDGPSPMRPAVPGGQAEAMHQHAETVVDHSRAFRTAQAGVGFQ